MKPREDIAEAVKLHGDTAWHVCVLYFRRSDEAQDAWQETFLKYAQADGVSFNDEEHRKAWLTRVATNVCKDMLKAAHHRNVALDEATFDEGGFNHDAARRRYGEGERTGGSRTTARDSMEVGSATSEVLDAMRALDDPPRTPLYLALYLGYTAPEIASMTNAPVNTVYSWITRGKKQLREALR